MAYKTEQENFWAGRFGDEYIERNKGQKLQGCVTAFWSRVLSRTCGIGSILELGANIGLNLRALHTLLPEAVLGGVEINPTAAAQLSAWGKAEVFEQSLFDFQPARSWDMAFTKGVLIHLNPDLLTDAYDVLYRSTARYLCVAEYYNPTPVTVPYRGNTDRLYKRDFAGEIMERFPDLKLVDYGFAWRRDPVFPQDDMTWFLMEKKQPANFT